MSLFVVSAKDKTDLYRVNNDDLSTEKIKTFTDQNATVCLQKNLLAHTHENNVLNVVKIASDGTTTDICKIQLKDDIRLIQFSPLGTYVQLVTYAESGDNLFIYKIDQPDVPVYVCHKKIVKPENSDPQPFSIVFNNDETQMLVQQNETLHILDSSFKEIDQIPAHAKNNGFVPCSYFFLGDKFVLSYASTKQISGKISVFKGKDLLFDHINAKVAKYQFGYQNTNFFVARLMFDDGGNYYGNSQLILFDINKKTTEILVKNSLNAFCIYQPQSYNPQNTSVIIASEGNPCQLKFVYLTYQQSSNSMIIKRDSYKHKVYINAMYVKNDLAILRGESGMDGEIYVATWSRYKVKVIIKKLQRDITHVNILKNCILFSTQRPRFQVDNSFYINDLQLKQQTKIEYDGLRFLKEVEDDNTYENIGKMDDMPEVEIESAEKQKVGQQTGVYVPPALRAKQGQSGQGGAPKKTSYSRFQ